MCLRFFSEFREILREPLLKNTRVFLTNFTKKNLIFIKIFVPLITQTWTFQILKGAAETYQPPQMFLTVRSNPKYASYFAMNGCISLKFLCKSKTILSGVKFNTPSAIWSSNGRPVWHKILVSFQYFPVLAVVYSYVRHVDKIKFKSTQVQNTSLLEV